MKKLLILIISLFLLANLISAACEENQIDINIAPAEDLVKINYIAEKRAEQMITLRPFSSVDDMIRIVGIGKVYLEAIKSQGLACVEGSEEEKEEIVDEKDKIEKVEEIGIVEEYVSKENDFPIELELIELNSKSIKTENDKESQDNKNKQNSGIKLFIVFCGLLFLLFSIKLIKNKFKYKNEFG